MASLAAAPPPPVKVQFAPVTPTHGLDNNTEIDWDAASDAPSGTHYEIVWRPMTAPDWTRSIPAERLTSVADGKYSDNSGHYSITIPVSKDNVIFGVCAVDAKGHRSPAVVPWPAPRPTRG
jgi:hypothetical protein